MNSHRYGHYIGFLFLYFMNLPHLKIVFLLVQPP